MTGIFGVAAIATAAGDAPAPADFATVALGAWGITLIFWTSGPASIP